MLRFISPGLFLGILFTSVYFPALAEEDLNRTLFALAQSLAKHADHGPASPMNWALLTPTRGSEILVKNRDNMLGVLEPREGQIVELVLSHPELLLSEEGRPISLETRVDSISMKADSTSSLLLNERKLHAVLRWEGDFFILASSFGPSWVDYIYGSNGAGKIVISVGYKLDKVEDPFGMPQGLLQRVHEAFHGVEGPEQYEAHLAEMLRGIPRINLIPKFTRDNPRFYLNMGLRDFGSDYKDFLVKSLTGARLKGADKQRMKHHFEGEPHQGVGYLLSNSGDQYLIFSIFIEAYDFRDVLGAPFLKSLIQTPSFQKIEERFLASGAGSLCTGRLSGSGRILH